MEQSLTVQDVIKEFEDRTGHKVVYVTKSGSKLYGTDTPTSDTDYKGVFIPTKHSVLLKQDPSSYTKDTNNSKEKNSVDDIDFTIHSVYNFFNQLEKSETGAVDVLFSMFRKDTIAFEDENFTTIVKDNYKQFMNKNMKSFIGYALGQTKKFGIKGARYDELDKFVTYLKSGLNPSKDVKLAEFFNLFKEELQEQEFKYIKFVIAPGPRGSGDYKDIEYISVLGKLFEANVSTEYFMERVEKLYEQFGNRTKTIANTTTKTDFKALSHSLRIAEEVKELLETGFIKFPLANADHIREIKNGKANVEDTINEVQEVLSIVDTLLLDTDLPENSNRDLMDNLILGMLK